MFKRKVAPLIMALGMLNAACAKPPEDPTVQHDMVEAADNVREHLRKDRLSWQDMVEAHKASSAALRHLDSLQVLPRGLAAATADSIRQTLRAAEAHQSLDGLRGQLQEHPGDGLLRVRCEKAVQDAQRVHDTTREDYGAVRRTLKDAICLLQAELEKL